MRKFLAFAALAALAFLASACSGLGPTELTPVPPGTPSSGPINIVYQRPAGMTCLSAGTQFADVCGVPVAVTGDSNGLASGWPDEPLGLEMQAAGNGVFTAVATAPTTPPPLQLGIYVIDPWLCQPQWVCTVIVGRGISINGTRLKDGEEKTYFSFIPPTVYP